MSEPWRGSWLRLGGGRVVLGAAGIAEVLRHIATATATAKGDGIGQSEALRQFVADLRAELAEVRDPPAHAGSGSAEVPQGPGSASLPADEIDTAEVARMLGCGERNVRDLAARGVLASGRKVGRRLAFDRAEVVAEQLRRSEETRCA